jgi:hypothetical protein
VSSFTDLSALVQQPVHRRDRGQVDAFVEQRRPNLGDRQVAESFTVEDVDDLVGFVDAELAWRSRSGGRWSVVRCLACPVVATPRPPESFTGRSCRDPAADELVDRGVDNCRD